MDKIKAFFNNKITKTVEFILIAICCGGLIFAGVTVEEVAKVPALVAGYSWCYFCTYYIYYFDCEEIRKNEK